jgi:hypothetical protein
VSERLEAYNGPGGVVIVTNVENNNNCGFYSKSEMWGKEDRSTVKLNAGSAEEEDSAGSNS